MGIEKMLRKTVSCTSWCICCTGDVSCTIQLMLLSHSYYSIILSFPISYYPIQPMCHSDRKCPSVLSWLRRSCPPAAAPSLSSPCPSLTFWKCSPVLFWCRSCPPAADHLLSRPCPSLTYSTWTGSVLLSCPDVEAVLQQLTTYYPAHVPLSPIPFGQEVLSCPVLI